MDDDIIYSWANILPYNQARNYKNEETHFMIIIHIR